MTKLRIHTKAQHKAEPWVITKVIVPLLVAIIGAVALIVAAYLGFSPS